MAANDSTSASTSNPMPISAIVRYLFKAHHLCKGRQTKFKSVKALSAPSNPSERPYSIYEGARSRNDNTVH